MVKNGSKTRAFTSGLIPVPAQELPSRIPAAGRESGHFSTCLSHKLFVFNERDVAPALRSLLTSADKLAGEAQMKRAVRIALGSAALATSLAFAGASPANAQVQFEGSIPLPHGRISVGVGGGGLSG